MANKRTNGRRCKFESLESRRLAAGTVTAQVVGGTAIIKGDNFGNGVVITPGPNPLEVTVTGATASQLPTIVGGVPNGSITLVNVINGLRVDMGLGNDNVTIRNLTINEKVVVKTGSGVDNVQIVTSTFNGALKVKLGQNADVLNVTTTTVLGKTTVIGGQAHDNVTLNGVIVGALNVSLGKGNDTFTMQNSVVHTKTVLNGGKGINLPTINTGNFLGGMILKKNFAG
jgi:hypothetical protein